MRKNEGKGLKCLGLILCFCQLAFRCLGLVSNQCSVSRIRVRYSGSLQVPLNFPAGRKCSMTQMGGSWLPTFWQVAETSSTFRKLRFCCCCYCCCFCVMRLRGCVCYMLKFFFGGPDTQNTNPPFIYVMLRWWLSDHGFQPQYYFIRRKGRSRVMKCSCLGYYVGNVLFTRSWTC